MTKKEKLQEDLIIYLKAVTISHSPDEEYENKLLKQLAELKVQKEELIEIDEHYFEFMEWVRKNCTIIDFKNDKWWQFSDKYGWKNTSGIKHVYEYWTKNTSKN